MTEIKLPKKNAETIYWIGWMAGLSYAFLGSLSRSLEWNLTLWQIILICVPAYYTGRLIAGHWMQELPRKHRRYFVRLDSAGRTSISVATGSEGWAWLSSFTHTIQGLTEVNWLRYRLFKLRLWEPKGDA